VPKPRKLRRRQPFNLVSLERVIPVLWLIAMRINRYEQLSWILPPSKCAILNDVVQLKALHPGAVYGVAQIAKGNSYIAKRYATSRGGIDLIGPHKERRVNRHCRTLRVNGEAYLDRVKGDVAALNKEERKESNGKNRHEREFDIHRSMNVRYMKQNVKGAMR